MQCFVQNIAKITVITEEILWKIFLVVDLYELVFLSSKSKTTPKQFIFIGINLMEPTANPNNFAIAEFILLILTNQG